MINWVEFLPGWNGHYVYDVECVPNFFSCRITRIEDGAKWCFELSEWTHQGKELNTFLHQIALSGGRMIGFNNQWYDYPMLHLLMSYNGIISNSILYNKSQLVIAAGNGPQKDWTHVIWESDTIIPQVDLFKIHHFDNKAKTTSLKLLEFNMRLDNISELTVDWNKPVTWEGSREMLQYNDDDVGATVEFAHHTKEMIAFRDELTKKYGKDFTNYNDTKIGEEIVKIELSNRGVKCNKYTQTIRDKIVVSEVILPSIQFTYPEFNQVLDYFRNSVIDPEKIKGFFKESDTDEETKFTSVTVNGFTFDYGAGGLHGCIKPQIIRSDDKYVIVDIDYASFYPRISIENGIYPKHLGIGWCDAMSFMFDERIRLGKKSVMGAAYKLGLNGSYGKSNDKFSAFYDPQYTMAITINGQFIISMLCELLMINIPEFQLIFVNTDGICCRIPRFYEQYLHQLCEWSDKQTGLTLECQNYKMLAIKDVNNYIGVLADD